MRDKSKGCPVLWKPACCTLRIYLNVALVVLGASPK